jgi:hypothetical protein
MKRLLIVIGSVVALFVAACHSSDPIYTSSGIPIHWQENVNPASGHPEAERAIHVIVPLHYMADAGFANAIRHAVAQGDRSPYVNFILRTPDVASATCPEGQHSWGGGNNCITVYRQSMNGAIASFGWDSAGHMKGWAVRVGFDVNGGDWLINAACHEIAGHGLGLAHSSDGTMGPCQTNLTDHDLKLINTHHGDHNDPLWQGTTTTQATVVDEGPPPNSDLHWETHRHSREFYKKLGKAKPSLAELNDLVRRAAA